MPRYDVLKVMVVDNCADCEHALFQKVDEDLTVKVCSIIGKMVSDYDSDFQDVPEFHPECPLADHKSEITGHILKKKLITQCLDCNLTAFGTTKEGKEHAICLCTNTDITELLDGMKCLPGIADDCPLETFVAVEKK